MTGKGWLLPVVCVVLFFTYLPNSSASTINSLSGRFVISGDDSTRNYETARWAEDTSDRFDRLLELAMPPKGHEAIEIVFDPDSVIPPTVEILIATNNDALRRRLTVKRVPLSDQTLMQQGLVHLMLAGLIDLRRREAHFAPVIPSIPAWLVAGLAGGMDRGQVARSRTIVSGMVARGEVYALTNVFEWTSLPEGWHSRQALCVMVTDWLISRPGARSNLLDHLVRQHAMTSESLAGVIGVSSLSQMEADWLSWLSQQQRLIQEFGTVSLEMIDQLRAETWLQIPTPRGESVAVRGLSPAEVISMRKQPLDITALASRKIAKIQRMTLGAAPEFVEVGEKYVLFYEGIVQGAWGMTLRWRLSRAETALEKLARQTLQRKVYLDDFEKNLKNNTVNGIDSFQEEGKPEFEKSSMESYLDGAEKRFDKLQ